MTVVRGQCPMGCGNTLFVGHAGHVTCSSSSCPDPGAVAGLLERAPAVRRSIISLAERLSDAWWVEAARDLDSLVVAVNEPSPAAACVRNRTAAEARSA